MEVAESLKGFQVEKRAVLLAKKAVPTHVPRAILLEGFVSAVTVHTRKRYNFNRHIISQILYQGLISFYLTVTIKLFILDMTQSPVL